LCSSIAAWADSTAACAWRYWAASKSFSRRKSVSPAWTLSPSDTKTSATLPLVSGAMIISVASMTPDASSTFLLFDDVLLQAVNRIV